MFVRHGCGLWGGVCPALRLTCKGKLQVAARSLQVGEGRIPNNPIAFWS